MATWSEVEAAEPAFAARVRALLDAEKHKTIATLRADGGPRISGIEVEFADGELTFGSMPAARKGADLHRDPRFALHSGSVAPPEGEEAEWAGDAKVTGLAVPAGPVGEMAGELFRADVREVVLTRLNPTASALRIEWWTPEQGLRSVERE
jgi:Pyridoxamine 5'-phosphate oxidase